MRSNFIKKYINDSLPLDYTYIKVQEVNIKSLLGENIYKASFLGSAANELDDNSYLISDPKILFLGMSLYHIGIRTYSGKLIKSILLTFQVPNKLLFYRKMIDTYGEDYEVMIRDKIISKTAISYKVDEFNQLLQRREISLKPGTIEDPDIAFIKWQKEECIIEYIPERGLNFKKE
ncbi:hypothetical protein LZ575_10025 [Antarcticibacterium sp. 1MA-6-2]|uniref:hypothetical protein n=1 Tax=Antarcticibacterium sp. 1MA-6-2 TaxID=2908210 RepID=UPI001F3C37FC|nr:hypothetical protein [Antarcticibacterium sp. 1MA-6-2]UJH92746.1 hypothetical protein LZ575_10025 [Antarcticibacterium sp. 1MA-6-2]